MDTKSSSLTIADLCDQLKTSSIIVNHTYQRTAKVWPQSAKSYLIDTILSGYPVPKIALYQKLDLTNRRTVREIVDGQQRTKTILDFYNDKLKITGKSVFSGKYYSQLEETYQRKFLEYALSVDVFVGATENDIRQVFRRMNSYTVPLNPEEKRHATFQGKFKWFIVDLIERYTGPLKQMGVLTEANISRMQDAKLFSEIIYSIECGIDHAQDKKLDRLYELFDKEFQCESDISIKIESVMSSIVEISEIHSTELMKPYNFYSLFLAVYHSKFIVPTLNELAPVKNEIASISNASRSRLVDLVEALISGVAHTEDQVRYLACTEKATNRKGPREGRFEALVSIIGAA
jgi:hypothetical protein